MKRILFTAAIAAIATLSSCVKEQGTPLIPGTPMAINLKLDNKETKAITGAQVDKDSKVNDMIVFITRADDTTFDVSPQYLTTADFTLDDGNVSDVIELKATVEAANIYIVTNTGPYLSGPFSGLPDMDAVKAVALKLDDNTHGGEDYSCHFENVWMAGETSTITDTGTTNSAGVKIMNADIQLHYVVAKVYVITENSITGNYGTNTRLDGVTLTNAGGHTGFFMGTNGYEVPRSDDFQQFPFYQNGIDWTMDAAPTEYSDVPALFDGTTDFEDNDTYSNQIGFDGINAGASRTLTTADALSDGDAFYVAPVRSDATETTVWASIYGKYNPAGLDDTAADRDTFWSVAFGGADNTIAGKLAAGKQYIITLELNGTDGTGSGGEDEPTKEIIETLLTIDVDVAEWDVVIVEKIIG
jgi:hypothetical protein